MNPNLRLITVSNNPFLNLEDINFFKLKFHFSDDIARHVAHFGTLNLLYTSPIEPFNYITQKFAVTTSFEYDCCLKEAGQS